MENYSYNYEKSQTDKFSESTTKQKNQQTTEIEDKITNQSPQLLQKK